MNEDKLTPAEMKKQFDEEGYLLMSALFNTEEVELLYKISKADLAFEKESVQREDATGQISQLALRNELDDDQIYSAIARSRRVVDTMRLLLGDEVYHYHHKLMYKQPRIGGAWEWHQDYGYWYIYGCLYPEMGSCYISIDPSTRENGCLQVIPKSHKLGRIDHGKSGGQTGADLERVEAVLTRLELVYCEMKPGDALFFHSNLLHRSDQNKSDHSRWSLICCYNTRHNDPLYEYKRDGRHPNYSPLEVWPDEKVLEVGQRQWEALEASV